MSTSSDITHVNRLLPQIALLVVAILPILVYAYALQWGTREDIDTSVGLFYACLLALAGTAGVLASSSLICRVFFVVAPFQIVIGYFSAFPAIWATEHIPQNYWLYFRQALAIFALGFVGLACGYVVTPHSSKSKWVEWLAKTETAKLPRYFALLCLAAAVLAGFAYYSSGVVPLFADNPLAARYFGSGETNAAMEMLHNAGSLAGFCLPILILSFWCRTTKKPRYTYLLTIIITAVALVLGSQRAFILVALLVTAAVLMTVYPKRSPIALLMCIAALGLYLAWQAIMSQGDISLIVLYGNSLGEVRDFGILLGVFNGHLLYGSTYLAALIPLPLTASPFRAEHNIIAATMRILDLDASVIYAGIRMTIFGEAYLNFGLMGSIGVGALFGAALKKFDSVLSLIQIRLAGDPMRAYPAVALATLFIIAIYETSTNAPYNYVAKPAVLLVVLYAIARKRGILPISPAAGVQGENSALIS